jgi:hypothetical protein
VMDVTVGSAAEGDDCCVSSDSGAGELAEVDDGASSAHATPGVVATAPVTPSATASAPTRPMYLAYAVAIIGLEFRERAPRLVTDEEISTAVVPSVLSSWADQAVVNLVSVGKWPAGSFQIRSDVIATPRGSIEIPPGSASLVTIASAVDCRVKTAE